MLPVRDSQLTDYDISDFNAHESNWSEPGYQQIPQRIEEAQRRTTNDSDDYVKVNEPIYDYPPRPTSEKKRISPTEAAQLQELCQEYDLGLDIPGVASQRNQEQFRGEPVQQQQFYQQHQDPFRRPDQDQFRGQQEPIQQQNFYQQQHQEPTQEHQFYQQNQDPFRRQDQAPQQQHQDPFHRQDSQPQTIINVPINRPIPIQGRDDPKNLATADLFVQDAIEYLGGQQKPAPFVMEEDMLRSHEEPKQQKSLRKMPSGEATSRQVRTNDVFERVEHDEHDDMTYAPEIQSVMIPPDQMSETSENMIDYFDKVAADSEAQIHDLRQDTLKKQPPNRAQVSNKKPVGRAPQILPAFGNRATSNSSLGSGRSGSSDMYPYRNLRKQSSLLSVLGVTSMQEMLLQINSLDALSEAMRRAGLETTNLIFGIDYTASNKYQGEDSFGGRSLHTIHPNVKNPYQQVITILGRTLAPFAGHGNIGVYGFGDAKTGDWSTFNLKSQGDCRSLDDVLNVYNAVTPNVSLSGPTNFAPLIYQAMETCQKSRDYHILVIIADGQVTNERATRRAIVQACQHPLSIIVVGVGDGPWDMMKIFDESLPKRPWDNFHFVEFHDIIKKSANLEDGDVKVAVQSLLEIPDQYRCICELGLLDRSIPPRGSEIRRELMHNPL
ncbi:unnamed protein product [Caenorhabditis angaria]|uniref:VWFA domain-containing protein n=1 Tax=Caenorhabditis angaria TaxID=860376 RepID=A0A9P1I9V6_9PELO|nr:unnamed protein product [Caenorhabditis angaria]